MHCNFTCTDQLYINRVEFVQINKIKIATILVLFVDYSVYYLLACNLRLILLNIVTYEQCHVRTMT